jgi:hypothetical protein
MLSWLLVYYKLVSIYPYFANYLCNVIIISTISLIIGNVMQISMLSGSNYTCELC